MTQKLILLAEDHVETRKIVGLVLAEEEFELLESSNGLETLELVKARHPDLLLLDLVMPNLNGVEVCRRLRSDPETAEIKVIALTGDTAGTTRDQAMRAGFDDYITKPFSPSKLLQTIRFQLSGKK
jgi:CheY-like chemotaxis protein